jgi:hypothetical protein
MSKFKVGDRVCSIAGDWSATDGREGVITQVRGGIETYDLEVTFEGEFLDCRGPNPNEGWWMNESELEVVQ